MKWIKDNWRFVTTILMIVGGIVGLKITEKDGAIIIVPETPAPVFTNAESVVGKDPERNRRVLFAIAKIKAGRQYAKEHDGLTESAGIALARSVPDEQIMAAVKAANVDLTTMPVGGPLQNLLDWLAAHPEIMQKIMEIILMLIPLFAKVLAFPWMLPLVLVV